MPLDKNGREIPDPEPIAVPLRLRGRDTLKDQVQALVARELSARAAEAGEESFEDSEDFDIDDGELPPMTPYEIRQFNGVPETRSKSPKAKADSLPKGEAEAAAPKGVAETGVSATKQ